MKTYFNQLAKRFLVTFNLFIEILRVALGLFLVALWFIFLISIIIPLLLYIFFNVNYLSLLDDVIIDKFFEL